MIKKEQLSGKLDIPDITIFSGELNSVSIIDYSVKFNDKEIVFEDMKHQIEINLNKIFDELIVFEDMKHQIEINLYKIFDELMKCQRNSSSRFTINPNYLIVPHTFYFDNINDLYDEGSKMEDQLENIKIFAKNKNIELKMGTDNSYTWDEEYLENRNNLLKSIMKKLN